MTQYQEIIHNKKFLIHADEELFQEVQGIFEEIKNLDEEFIKDNLIMQIGFSFFYLKSVVEDKYRVLTVNYKKNPFQYLTEDLSMALRIEKDQKDFVEKLKITREESRFDDRVMVARDALSERAFKVKRRAASYSAKEDWGITRLDNKNQDFFPLYAYELQREYQGILKLFALPYEYSAVVKQGKVVEVRDNKKEIL